MTKVTKEVVVVGAGCVFQVVTLCKAATEDGRVGRISGLVTGISLKTKLAVENFTVWFFSLNCLLFYHQHIRTRT